MKQLQNSQTELSKEQQELLERLKKVHAVGPALTTEDYLQLLEKYSMERISKGVDNLEKWLEEHPTERGRKFFRLTLFMPK